MNAPTSFKLKNITRGAAGFCLTALLAMSAATAQVASGSTGIDATGNAKSELAACNNGKTQEDRPTCLKEVRNAQAAKRAGKLGNADSQQYAANALKRCDVFKTSDDLTACRARVDGQGKIEGGVASGGLLREAETVVSPVAQ